MSKYYHFHFRKWLVACLAPSHYLNPCWIIVNWTLRNENTKLFIHENTFENVISEMAAILPMWRRWVNLPGPGDWLHMISWVRVMIGSANYHQTSNIRHQIPKLKCFSCPAVVFAQSIEPVQNEDVVGAVLTGDSPNTSEWSEQFFYCLLRCDLY